MKKISGVIVASAVLFSLVFSTPARAGRVQWPGFAYDPARTGQSPYNGPSGNRLKWRFTIPGWGSNVVVGAEGVAYFGTRSGVLFAVDKNGRERWRFRIPRVKIRPPEEWPEAEKREIGALGYPVCINSVALGPNGTIYFGESIHVFTVSTTRGYSEPGHRRKLYALRPDKSVKFTFSTGEADVATHISVGVNGAIYFGTIEGDYKKGECRFYSLRPNGEKKWETLLSRSGSILSPAIGGDGVIYVGGDKLRALRPGDGSMLWEYDIQTTTSIAASPAIAPDGTILVCTRPTAAKDPYKLFAIHSDGSLKWSLPVGSMETSPAIGADGTIYITSATRGLPAVYSDPSIKTGLSAITPEGRVKWSHETRFPDWHPDPAVRGKICGSDSSPIIGADGVIYFGADTGEVYALDPDGTLKWNFGVGGEFDNCPAMDEDGVLYICHSGGRGEAGRPWRESLACYAIGDEGAMSRKGTKAQPPSPATARQEEKK